MPDETNFTVLYDEKPPFKKGDVVTRALVEKAGYDFDHWLGHHGLAVVPAAAARPSPDPLA